MGSLPAFAWGDVANAQPLSTPLQDGLGFFHPLMPARLWARLTARFPFWERYGLTTFRTSTSLDELGSAYPPVARHLREAI